jgi:hypothetical protein
MGLFRAHLFGSRRSYHDESDQQNCPTRQHPVPLSQSAMLINSLFTITFAVERPDELRTWLTCSIPPTGTKSAVDDDLAALTTRTVAAAFCIGSHFDVRAP